MAIECYITQCPFHSTNQAQDAGPYCYGPQCRIFEPTGEVKQIEYLQKDAERYRWLTEQSWFQAAIDRFDIDDYGMIDSFKTKCDKIIDNAITMEAEYYRSLW